MKIQYDTYIVAEKIAGFENFTMDNFRLYKMDESKTLCQPDVKLSEYFEVKKY